MNWFSSLTKPQADNTSAAQPNKAPNQPLFPNQQAPANQGTSPNGTQTAGDPNQQQQNQQNSQATQQQQHPLDAFAGLWDNKQQQTDAPPAFNLNPEELKKVSSNLRFADGIKPEMYQQAMGGDMNAFSSILDQVGRQAYEMALQHNSVLTDKYVGARSEFDRKQVNGQVKKELVNTSISSLNTRHPVIKKELTRIAEAMYAQNPDANPAEISQAAIEYFSQLSQAMNGPSADATKQSQPTEVVWDNFFDPKS